MGIWRKYDFTLAPISSDNASGLHGTSNQSVFYETGAKLISPNADGKVFKMLYTGGNNLCYAETNNPLTATWTRYNTDGVVISNTSVTNVFKNGSTYYAYGNQSPWTSIKVWTATDLIGPWTLIGTALSPGTSGNFDDGALFYLKPFYQGASVWYATYTCTKVSGGQISTGMATSMDLLTWTNGSTALTFGNGTDAWGGLTGPPFPVQCVQTVGSYFYAWAGMGGYETAPATGNPVQIGRSFTAVADPPSTTWSDPFWTLRKTLANEGVDSSTGNMGNAYFIRDDSAGSSIAGLTYLFYTATPHEDTASGYQVFVATTTLTMAQIVQTTEQNAAQNGGVQTFYDDFQRGSYPENPLSGGGKWTTQASALKVLVAGRCEPATAGTGCNAAATGVSFNNNQWCEFVIGKDNVTVVSHQLWARASAAFVTNSIQMGGQGNAFPKLWHFISGTPTSTVTCAAAGDQTGKFAALDVWRVTVENGSVWRIYQNGIQVGTVTDSTFASGNVGMGINATTTIDNGRITFFAAGNLQVNTPTFNPPAGSYASTQTVTVLNPDSALTGFAMYYTTDGSTPTTGSTAYTVPVSIASTSTLKVLAVATGYDDSAIGSAAYTINGAVATPTFSPVAGSYTSTQTVTISSATAGASLFYTTDGSTPTSGSTPYTTPVSVASSLTLKAIGTKTAFSDSAVGSAAYTISSGGATGQVSVIMLD